MIQECFDDDVKEEVKEEILPEPAPAPEPVLSDEVLLLKEIRDLLKDKN